MDRFDYKVNSASEDDIGEHFNEALKTSKSELRRMVDTKTYAEKIRKFAYTFECWDNNILAGLAACYFNDPKGIAGYITYLSVLSDYQGKNIGYNLMNRIIGKALELNFQKLSSEVVKNNERAISLHKKSGFYVSEYSEDEDTYIMTKMIR